MKIEIAKSDLNHALAVVSSTVNSSGSDLSSHFLFRIRGENAEILTCHNRTFSSTPLKCNFEGSDGQAFTVEAWRLEKWLSGVGDVAVVLQLEGAEVRVSGGRSVVRLRSLDPQKFPFWDATIANANVTGSVPASRLASAIGYARQFVSSEDTTRPEIAQIEAIDGSLWSSDRRSVSIVKVEGLPDSSLRVSSKDLPAVIKFLNVAGSDDVEVLESDSAVFFRRPNGSHIGASRPMVSFPRLKVDETEGEVWLQFPTSEFHAAINVLSAAAAKGNERIRFQIQGERLWLAMDCEAGGEDVYPIDLTGNSNLSDFPEGGFAVDYGHLLSLCSHFSLDVLDLEVTRKGKGGYIAFRRENENGEGNSYFSVIVWRT